MGRIESLALAFVLTLAGVGVARAQEPGDLPELDVDISIDLVTDFDHLEHGADLSFGDDDGDVHVVTPGDRDRDHGDGEHGDHDDGEAGEHDDGEVEDHHEVEMENHGLEMEGHEAEMDDDFGGGIEDVHEDGDD